MNALAMISFAGLSVSMAYTAFAIARVVTLRKRRQAAALQRPVTIAKPLCGVEPELEENLRSFCDQDYPQYEVFFAARDADDPALGIAKKLNGTVVVAPRVYGPNLKMSNLVAVAERAKHDIFVIADSDMRVGRDYLHAVTAPFADERVGAVTCLYAGRPIAGTASTLGAMFINESFLPSVLVALAIQPLDFCLGATMAVRREALEAIGGFEALSRYLADDYMLGHLVRQRGWTVELAPYVVENIVSEPTVGELFQHELRWARTIRTVRPAGYTFSVLTMILPWASAFLLASRFSPLGWSMFAAALLLRAALHIAVKLRLRLARPPAMWWIPLRDALSFAVYCASHFGRSVLWKQMRFDVSTDGQLHHQGART